MHASFGGKNAVAQLFPGFSRAKNYRRNGILIVAVLLLGLAMLNPQVPDEQSGTPVSGLEVVLAIDVSNSMLATDVAPNRLDQTRLIAQKLIDTLQGSKIAVVAFAGEAWLQLPLTNDLQAARLLVSGVDGKSVPLEGTDIQQALQLSNQSLPPTDMKHKAIVLFTDGEALDGDATAMVEELKKSGVMLITVGVGTPAGSTLKDDTGTPIRNEDGSVVVSKLNEAALLELATKTGGKFIEPGTADVVAASITSLLQGMPKKPLVNSYMVNYYSYSHWLILLAILLLMCAAWMTEKGKQKSPVKESLLAAAMLLLVMQASAQSAGNKDETNAQLQQADELYKKGKLVEAEEQYKAIAKADPQAWMAALQLGNIAYKRGAYDEALKQYDNSLKNVQAKEGAAALHNNMGLSLVRMKKLEDAIAAFKQALRTDPNDAEITRNLNMALDEMKRAQKQPPPPKPDPKKQDEKKAEDQLNALQQEEKKIKENLQKQKKSARPTGNKNW